MGKISKRFILGFKLLALHQIAFLAFWTEAAGQSVNWASSSWDEKRNEKRLYEMAGFGIGKRVSRMTNAPPVRHQTRSRSVSPLNFKSDELENSIQNHRKYSPNPLVELQIVKRFSDRALLSAAGFGMGKRTNSERLLAAGFGLGKRPNLQLSDAPIAGNRQNRQILTDFGFMGKREDLLPYDVFALGKRSNRGPMFSAGYHVGKRAYRLLAEILSNGKHEDFQPYDVFGMGKRSSNIHLLSAGYGMGKRKTSNLADLGGNENVNNPQFAAVVILKPEGHQIENFMDDVKRGRDERLLSLAGYGMGKRT